MVHLCSALCRLNFLHQQSIPMASQSSISLRLWHEITPQKTKLLFVPELGLQLAGTGGPEGHRENKRVMVSTGGCSELFASFISL